MTGLSAVFAFVVAVMAPVNILAQTNLSGRVYYHANIMEEEMKELTKGLDKDLKEAKAKAIEKAEKEKGKKLTEAELAEIERKVDEAQKMAQALKRGMKTSVTVTFKDEQHVVVDMGMKIDDNALKAAGLSWAKRKMIKLATKVMPSQKGTYTVDGNQVFIDDGEELDTMRLSDDGKYLYGKMDDKKKFRLTRTK